MSINIVVEGKKLIDYLPESNDPNALLALALYREALNVNSVPYKFLGFYKILNIGKKGPAQIDWINQTIDHLLDSEASSRIITLKTNEPDVGKYLYASGRCSVAHAYDEHQSVNPDDPIELKRLSEDLPVIKALAEYFIEHELGIKSQKTV